MRTLTATYPFVTMSVGDSFTVYQRFQHCRVAASEYARRHDYVFTCRMQDDGSMTVYRVEANQRPVDQRGARGRRRIVRNNDPSQVQFNEWLAGFAVGQSYIMPASYSHLYALMAAWCQVYGLTNGCTIDMVNDTITRLA